MKHTRPDLANATRELSEAMDVANYLHWRELLWVIVYPLKTQKKGIVLNPDKKSVILNLKFLWMQNLPEIKTIVGASRVE